MEHRKLGNTKTGPTFLIFSLAGPI